MDSEDQDLKEAEQITIKVALAGSIHNETQVGTTLDDRYRIDALIGSGATSCVYQGFDLIRKRDVAIKILHRHLMIDGLVVRRFEQEAETAQIVTHPNIVDIHDLKRTGSGQPYLVMELVRGQSLQDVMSASGGWIEWRRAIDIALQIGAALRAAHEKGVVHRDMKPANIMVATDSEGKDHVKVLDFGIAKVTPLEGETFFKLTQTGETLGSLLYMSPEQCNGEQIDARSDVYSLGCVLYEILTGTAPLVGRTAFETMNKHVSSMPERLKRVRPNLEVPDALERIVFKAVSKKPSERYQTIGEFQDDLLALRDGLTVKAPTTVAGSRITSGTTVVEELKGCARVFQHFTGFFFVYMVTLVVFTAVTLFSGSLGVEPIRAVYNGLVSTVPLFACALWWRLSRKRRK